MYTNGNGAPVIVGPVGAGVMVELAGSGKRNPVVVGLRIVET
jgi:hypothetical protein